MPFANNDGTRLFYKVEQSRDTTNNAAKGRPTLVFSHSLGVDHSQWDPQIAPILPDFKILRYDVRGHGASDAPAGDYSLAQLGQDALAVCNHAGVDRFAFCGLSLGGMVGQWLGANAGNRLTQLVLANTTPKSTNTEMMEERRKKALATGTESIADAIMQRFFTPQTLSDNLPRVDAIRGIILATNPAGYAGCCAMIRDMDNTEFLPKIHTPTLVIYGDQDLSTPWRGNAEILVSRIAGAKAVELPAAHLSNVEVPERFTEALRNFLLA